MRPWCRITGGCPTVMCRSLALSWMTVANSLSMRGVVPAATITPCASRGPSIEPEILLPTDFAESQSGSTHPTADGPSQSQALGAINEALLLRMEQDGLGLLIRIIPCQLRRINSTNKKSQNS